MANTQYRSMAELVERLKLKGFSETFAYLDGGLVSIGSKRAYEPAELRVRASFRFEGQSNPEDMSVVYLIEGPDGVKGTIVDAFGVYGDPELGALIEQIPYEPAEADLLEVENMETITREELKKKLQNEKPDNEDRSRGYALINVLKREDFLNEHIPGSLNIPKGSEQDFERRFDKQKEIIVYCASPQCPASTSVAQELVNRGFTRVVEFEGGMSEWKERGNDLERGESEIHEVRMY